VTDTTLAPFVRDVLLHPKLPQVAVTSLSLPMLARDAIVDRLKAMPFFAPFKFTTHRMHQIMPASLPFCGLYFIQEIGGPSPEPQTGPTEFRTTVRYGLSAIVQNNDGAAAEYMLDRAYQNIVNIYADPTLRNNQLFKIMSFNSQSRQHIFGSLGQNNETPFAELRFEFVADFGWLNYPMPVIDVLETIHVTTDYPYDSPGTPDIISQYDIPQE
jgi:hypothetical protein